MALSYLWPAVAMYARKKEVGPKSQINEDISHYQLSQVKISDDQNMLPTNRIDILYFKDLVSEVELKKESSIFPTGFGVE